MAKVLSVEIGASLIRLCEVDRKEKNPKVYKWASIQTPEGAVADDAVVVTEELVNAIKDVLREKHMSAKKMIFTMNSTKIASRDVVIPFVKENKVGELVKSNASDYFPVDLEQYELGHFIDGTTENDKGVKQYKVHVLAAPKSITESYKELAKALGGTLEALDYISNSVYRMAKPNCESGAKMIVKTDEKSSSVLIIKDGEISLQRNIAYGMEDLKISEDGSVSSCTGEEMADSLDYLSNGILRVVDYYNSHNSEAVTEAYVTGLGAYCKGIEEYLSEKLSMHVEILPQPEIYRSMKDFSQEEYGLYLTCIGAAMNPVGFIEKADNTRKIEGMPDSKESMRVCILALAGCVVIAAALVIVSGVQVSRAQKENKRLNDRIVELEPIKEVYRNYLQQEYTTTKLEYLYNTTVHATDDLVAFIEEMEQKMPASLNVQSFMADDNGVSMSLTVKDKKEAAKLIQQFRSFDVISTVSVSALTDTGAVMAGEALEQEPMVSFSIALTYKGQDEANADMTAQEAAEAAVEQQSTEE